MKDFKIITTAVIAVFTAMANAQIAYNTFGDGDSYNTTGYGIAPLNGVAMNFDSATTGAVSRIVLALSTNYLYNVSINADDNGLPGTALESWTGVANNGQFVVKLLGDGSASLTTGSSYWVVVLADGNQAGNGVWYDEDTSVHFAEQSGSNQWYAGNGSAGAYRVETTPVPESASAAALGVGVAVVGVRKRRKAKK